MWCMDVVDVVRHTRGENGLKDGCGRWQDSGLVFVVPSLPD